MSYVSFLNRVHYVSEIHFRENGEIVVFLVQPACMRFTDFATLVRCLYNALNDRIRNLLLEYDYSKSTDPLQPLAAHISSLLTRTYPATSDIVVMAADESLSLHKFLLAARSSYFRNKLAAAPGTTTWNLPSAIPPQAFGAAIKYLYLGEVPRDLRSGPGTGYTESEVFAGVDKIAKYLEIQGFLDTIIDSADRRLTRQRRSMEISKGRDQLESWFQHNVLGSKVVVETSKANDVKWDRNNAIFADVLLRADETAEDLDEDTEDSLTPTENTQRGRPLKSVFIPCHRAMLLRSEFFNTMFSSTFREAHVTDHLNVIPVDCSPEVLEIVLSFLYTDRADFGLDVAVEVLFAADMLFIERLKTKAAVVISTLGSANMSQAEATKTRGAKEEEDIDIYAIMQAAWLTRIQRLEEFAARYLAYRLEAHIDTPEFAELIQESAYRIQGRQETDTIELLDDIRFYLGERFRLRFDDAGLEQLMSQAVHSDSEQQQQQQQPETTLTTTTTQEEQKLTNKIENLDLSSPQPAAPAVAVRTAPELGTSKPSAPAKTQTQTQERGPASAPKTRTLDGGEVDDEFVRDAANYQFLMRKLDALLERLGLEA